MAAVSYWSISRTPLCACRGRTDDGRENSHIFAKELAQQLTSIYIFVGRKNCATSSYGNIPDARSFVRATCNFPDMCGGKKRNYESLFWGPTVRPHISHGKKWEERTYLEKFLFSRPVFMGISRCRSPSYITSPFKVGKLFQTYQDFPHKYTAHCQPKNSLIVFFTYVFFGSVLAVSFPSLLLLQFPLSPFPFIPRGGKKDIYILSPQVCTGKKRRVTGPRRIVPPYSISIHSIPATEERRYPAWRAELPNTVLLYRFPIPPPNKEKGECDKKYRLYIGRCRIIRPTYVSPFFFFNVCRPGK